MTLSELQNILKINKLDGYIITHNNQFIGQDILPEENRIFQISGFDGSAGKMFIMQDKAYLLTDGRYALQAPQQTKDKNIQVIITNGETIATWLQQNFSQQKLRIAYNPWCHTVSETDYWKRALRNFEFVENSDILSDSMLSSKEYDIFEHNIEYAGISMDEKISMLTSFMKEKQLQGFLITACDSVSWLLNLRSNSLPHSPILRAFAFINAQGEVSLYTNNFNSLEKELKNYKKQTIGMDCKYASRALFNLIKNHKIWIENLPDPIQNWKAIKNPIEISCSQKAHIRDGVALTRFLIWLENNYSNKTELDIVKKLKEFRQQGENYFSDSFDTIAGFGTNSAIVHYHPTSQTNQQLHSGSLLLLDSGAQYYDGTTDITRTIAIGTPTPEMIHDYTLVLKSHIALISAKFPENTSGLALDAITRAPLWQENKNYNHGTGHGVGFFSNVHEGPFSISSRSSLIPLQAGMITSIEPGYYRENHYGIRIENLAYIKTDTSNITENNMLYFEPLTLVPLDKRLIDKYLLNKDELAWINNYHHNILQQLTPLLTTTEVEWLQQACSPITL